jgi:hypothetical protein
MVVFHEPLLTECMMSGAAKAKDSGMTCTPHEQRLWLSSELRVHANSARAAAYLQHFFILTIRLYRA